jgi:hypothetical protein
VKTARFERAPAGHDRSVAARRSEIVLRAAESRSDVSDVAAELESMSGELEEQAQRAGDHPTGTRRDRGGADEVIAPDEVVLSR